MDSVTKGLMGAMLPQNLWARTAPTADNRKSSAADYTVDNMTRGTSRRLMPTDRRDRRPSI